MRKPFYLLAIASAFIVSCQQNISQPEITVEELKEHIQYLASDELGGRYPGTEGDKKAAEYIRNDFTESGLSLLGHEGLQKFSVVTGNKLDTTNSLAFEDFSADLYEDFVPFPFSGNKKIITSIEFVGYGLQHQSKKFKWNDYTNGKLNGQWAMIIRDLPDIGKNKQFLMSQKSDRSKALLAKEKGAGGVLFVSPNPEEKLVDPTIREGNLDLPVIHITHKTANIILKENQLTIEEIITFYQNKQKPNSFSIDKPLKANIHITKNEVITYNVLAEIKTEAKNQQDDYVVIGAHYDHLGMGGPESGSRRPDTTAVHYGADDNASGVAAMLEIAEKLNAHKDQLENNYLFIAFGAEEMGLIGSKYFTMHPLINIDQIKTMVNIDMIGRLKDEKELQIGGTGTSKISEKILDSINNTYQFKMGYSPEGYGPSDHSPFYSIHKPVFFFSTGPHLDYHTPSDVPEKINYQGMKEISNYIYDLARVTGEKSRQLVFQEAGSKSQDQKKHGEKLKVTLGIMPDFAGIEDKGLRADMVIKGKPADRAGMKNGDIITAINGHSVGDIYDYMERLSKLKPGQNITIEIIRNGTKQVLMVQL